MISHPGDPLHSSKGLQPPAPSFDPMQQYFHHLPLSHDVNMYNMNPLIRPSLGRQQAPTRFPPMINDSFSMGP